MAKNRMVNTKFWTDTYVLEELNPVDKLIYLYLITNPYTDISGVYELPLKIMAVETGIDKDNLVKVIIPRFEEAGKILYRNGWVAIKNFQKHQSTNPKVLKGMEIGLSKAPKELVDFLNDSLSIDYETSSHSNSNSNSNSNARPDAAPMVQEVIKAFEEIDPKNKTNYGNKTQRAAADFLISEYGLEQVLSAIAVLPQTNAMPYMPSITTPYELKEKWVKLQDAMRRKKIELTKPKRVVLSTIK